MFLLKAIKKLNGNRKLEKKNYHAIYDSHYHRWNFKATVGNSSDKSISVKIHVLKIVSVAKFYSDVRRYFVKQQKLASSIW